MAVGYEAERPVGWYVSRIVKLSGERQRSLGLLGGVVAPSGETLAIGDLLEGERPLEDHRSYSATLTFPGLIPVKLKVELVVTSYSSNLVEIGLRPLERVPQRRIGAARYFDAAWAVLDAVVRASLLAPSTARQGRQEQRASRVSSVVRGARRLARAS
jgi:hypothetical protein